MGVRYMLMKRVKYEEIKKQPPKQAGKRTKEMIRNDWRGCLPCWFLRRTSCAVQNHSITLI